MKKIALVFFLIPLFSISQARETPSELSFNSKSGSINKSTGWKKNETTDKWISNKNLIYNRESKYMASHVSQSFNWIEFRTVLFNGEEKYIFIYEKLSGEYKYPNIREDWEEELNTWFFIFSKEDYDKLKSEVLIQSGKSVSIRTKLNGKISNKYEILGGEHLYNEQNLLNSIKNTLKEKPSSYAKEKSFMFNSQIVNNEEIVRFILPITTRSYGKPLEDYYFEISKRDFSKILSLN